MNRSVRLLLSGLVLAMNLAGCEPTARVEGPRPANAIEKSDLHGEWYVQSTVLDAPRGAPVFAGLSDMVSVVRWEVQEKYLVGYRAYDVVQQQPDEEPITGDGLAIDGRSGALAAGTTCHDTASGRVLPCTAAASEGVPIGYAGRDGVECRNPEGRAVECFPAGTDAVYVFAIEAHLDSELSDGVALEDTSKPWRERRYIRVDWSRNLANGPEGGFLFWAQGWFENPVIATSTVEEGMPGEDALRYELDGHGRVDGISLVAHALVAPEVYRFDEFPWTQQYQACLYYEASDVPCGASDLRIRVTLRRAIGSDYEPKELDAQQRTRFPLYGAEVRNADPYRGELLEDRLFRPFRFNLWQQSFERDDSGNFVRDESGSRVPLPEAERGVGEVRYHLTGEWPPALFDDVERAVAEWDGVMREAVAFRLEEEIGKVPSVVKLSYNGRRKLVADEGVEDLCDELVAAGRAEHAELASGASACSLADYDPVADQGFLGLAYEVVGDADGPTATVGDLRHHVLQWHSAVGSFTGLYGYGPTAFDPRTGETLQASSHIYGAQIDEVTSNMVERINALNGFLVEAQVSQKTDLSGGPVSATKASQMSAQDLALPVEDAATGFLGADAGQRLVSLRSQGLSALPSTDAGESDLRRVVEAYPELTQAFQGMAGPSSWGPGLEASAFEWATSHTQFPLPHDTAGFRPCFSMLSADAQLIRGLARRYADAPITNGDAAWAALRERMVRNILTHEMGHNFGLKHNFQGSHDALNFSDEYWALRSSTLRPAPEVLTVGDFLELELPSAAQSEAFIEGATGSSVMDYSWSFTSPSVLGRFDRAAVLMSFANAVEVFDWDPAELLPEVETALRAAAVRNTPADATFTQHVHYTQIPYALGADLDEGLARLRQRRLADWDEVVAPGGGAADGPLPVPYEACSDTWRGSAPGCQPWDRGADLYELARAETEEQIFEYAFTSFRRGREFFDPYDVQAGHAVAMDRLLTEFGHGLAGSLDGDRDALTEAAFSAGAGLGFDFLTKLAALPEYGSFAIDEASGYYYQVSPLLGLGVAEVLPGVGRSVFDVESDAGAIDGYRQYEEAGHAWTRWFSMRTLAQHRPVSRVRDGQEQHFAPSYDLLFPDGVDHLLASFWWGDAADFGPRIDESGNLAFLDFKDLSAAPAGAPVYTRATVEQQTAVLVAAYAFLRDRQTLRFAENHGHAFRMGTSEEVEPGPGFAVISFSVPTSGIRYGTLQRLAAPGFGAAVRLVTLGQLYEDVYNSLPADDPSRSGYAATLQLIANDLDVMRTLYAEFANVDLVP